MDSRGQINRRTALPQAGALAAAVAALEAAGPLAFVPQRALAAAAPSDIQFDIRGCQDRAQRPAVHAAQRQRGVPHRRAGLVRRQRQAARQGGQVPGLDRAAQLHLEPAHVRADGAAEVDRHTARAAVRGLHPAPVTDVDGFRRPAGQRLGPGSHLHVRGQFLGAPDHRRGRRLFRPRCHPAPVPSDPGHTAVLRHEDADVQARRRRHVRQPGAVRVPRAEPGAG
jgi:hypothetical protein